MSRDYFEVLGLERRLVLGPEEVTEAFHAVSRTEHPDVAGEEGGFEAAAAGAAVLRDPVRRLKHWIGLEFPAGAEEREESGEGGEMISGDLLELFGAVNEAMQEADIYLKEKDACRTAVGRAMLASKGIERQRALSGVAARLDGALREAEGGFAELEALRSRDGARAEEMARALAQRMSFFSKWLDGVRKKIAGFI